VEPIPPLLPVFFGKPSQCDLEGFGFSPEDILQDKIMGYEK